jgi:hypothetical protein
MILTYKFRVVNVPMKEEANHTGKFESTVHEMPSEYTTRSSA